MSTHKKIFVWAGVVIVILIVLVSGFKFVVNQLRTTRLNSSDMGIYNLESANAVRSMGLGAFSSATSLGKAGMAPTASVSSSETPLSTDRLIIKTGSFSLVVQDIEETINRLVGFAENKGGFVVSKYVSTQNQRPSGRLEVRVPVDQLDGLARTAKEASVRVVSEQITGQDVTEEYVDLKARLANLSAAENRFRELLNRAQTIEDILRVQREIDRVRDEIDRETARKQYLERSSALSRVTFNLALDEEELPLVTPSEKWRPKAVFNQAVRGLFSVGRGLGSLAIWLGVLIPVWVAVAVVVLFVRYFVKRRRNKTIN